MMVNNMVRGERVTAAEIREFVRLRDEELLTYAKIAKETGRSEETVIKHLKIHDGKDEPKETDEMPQQETKVEETKEEPEAPAEDDEPVVDTSDEILKVADKDFYAYLDHILNLHNFQKDMRRYIVGGARDVYEWRTPQGLYYFLSKIRGIDPLKAEVIVKRLFSKFPNPPGPEGPGGAGFGSGPISVTPGQFPGFGGQSTGFNPSFAPQPNLNPFQQQQYQQPGVTPEQMRMEMERIRLEEKQRYEQELKRREDKLKDEREKEEIVGMVENMKKEFVDALKDFKKQQDDKTTSTVTVEVPIRNDEGKVTNIERREIPRDIYEKQLMEEQRERDFQRTRSMSQGISTQETETTKALKESNKKLEEEMRRQREDMQKYREETARKEQRLEKEKMQDQLKVQAERHEERMKRMEERNNESTARIREQMQRQAVPTSDPKYDLAKKELEFTMEKTLKGMEELSKRADKAGDTVQKLLLTGDKPKNVPEEQFTDDEKKKFDQLITA